jgi:hypothetical protein
MYHKECTKPGNTRKENEEKNKNINGINKRRMLQKTRKREIKHAVAQISDAV